MIHEFEYVEIFYLFSAVILHKNARSPENLRETLRRGSDELYAVEGCGFEKPWLTDRIAAQNAESPEKLGETLRRQVIQITLN